MGRVFLWVLTLLLLRTSLDAVAEEIPRVALLFISRAEMPLESIWREFFRSVHGLVPPPLSSEQWSGVMERQRVQEVAERLKNAGQLSANSLFQFRPCVDNGIILVRSAFECTAVTKVTVIVKLCAPSSRTRTMNDASRFIIFHSLCLYRCNSAWWFDATNCACKHAEQYALYVAARRAKTI